MFTRYQGDMTGDLGWSYHWIDQFVRFWLVNWLSKSKLVYSAFLHLWNSLYFVKDRVGYTIVSGYVCNHGSPSGERDTASPRGRYGERPQRDSVWRYIWKNTTCWPATAHDVTTGVPQYKCRREDTSSASSSEACVRSMAQSPGDAVSRSPLGEPWLHT